MPGDLVLDCVDLPRSSMWEGLSFYDAFPPEKWDATVRVTATDWAVHQPSRTKTRSGANAVNNPYFIACARDHRIKEASLILCSSLEHELDPDKVFRGLLRTARMTGGIIYLSSCNFQKSTTELDVAQLQRIAESMNGVLNTTTQDRTTIRCIPGSHGCDLLEVSFQRITSPLHFSTAFQSDLWRCC